MSAPPISLTAVDPAEARARLDQALLTCEAWRLVDTVAAQGDDWLEARWRPAPDADWYRGDGAGGGLLLPGTVTLEHVVQCGEALIYAMRGRPADDGIPVLAGVRRMRCRGLVRPGQTLQTRVRLLDQLGPAYVIHGRVARDDERVLDVTLSFTATAAARVLGRGV